MASFHYHDARRKKVLSTMTIVAHVADNNKDKCPKLSINTYYIVKSA